MLADDDGVGAVGGRSVAGGVPLLALAPERVRRCDFGGRRLPLAVFAMPVLCTALSACTCESVPFGHGVAFRFAGCFAFRGACARWQAL